MVKLNRALLKEKVSKTFTSQASCAKAMGLSRAYVNEMLSGTKQISLKIANKFVEVLNLTESETFDIFFNNVVD